MLTKLLALWIVVLAVSPFTEPFSTFRLGDLTGKSHTTAQKRSPADLVCATALDGVPTPELPSNPPIEVRPMVSVDVHVRVLLTASLGADPVASDDDGRPTPLDWDRHRALQPPSTHSLAVLRI